MDQDDPEKRIEELERQLSDARAASDTGASQQPQAPPAWTPVPPQPGAGQPAPPASGYVPPSPGYWENPTSVAPPAYSFPSAPSGRGGGGGRIALLLLVAGLPIIGLVIGGIIFFTTLHQATKPFVATLPSQHETGSQHSAGSQSSAGGSSSAGPTQFLTADGLTKLFAEIRNKFGDTMGYQLSVYPDYAVVDHADPQNSQHKRSYVYRSGSWSDFGEPEHVSSMDSLVDLSKFDPAAVAAKLPEAPQALNVPNPDSTYLIVEGDEGGTRIAIYESGNGDSGYMDLNPDGSVKAMHPQT